jgi:hypothetical protein
MKPEKSSRQNEPSAHPSVWYFFNIVPESIAKQAAAFSSDPPDEESSISGLAGEQALFVARLSLDDCPEFPLFEMNLPEEP